MLAMLGKVYGYPSNWKMNNKFLILLQIFAKRILELTQTTKRVTILFTKRMQ